MSSSDAAKAENTRNADLFISLPKLLWDSISDPIVIGSDLFGWISNWFIRENRENPPIEFKKPKSPVMLKLSEDGSHQRKEATVGIKWLEIAATRWSSGLVSIKKAKVSAAKIRVSGLCSFFVSRISVGKDL